MKLFGNTFLFLLLALLVPTAVDAAGLSLSVTPTMFEVAAVPEQSFQTSVKVINENKVPITVYAEAQNFAPQGERGHSAFLPLDEKFTEGTTLGEWMSVPDTPFEIKPGGTAVVPVSIVVPSDAAPGGHYAAVMIGTKPPADSGQLEVRTSQVITSLFFVRIAGDVVEKGSVRTFRSLDTFSQTPTMAFAVRFQNDGNVHLRPEGEIVITNMWGKERGIIPINHKSNFGNVLPESIREYEFSWTGEQSFSDIGRYTADLTLAYGLENRKFTSKSTHFWVVPVKPLAVTLVTLTLIIWFIVRMVRGYVRRMLLLSGIDPDAPKRHHRHTTVALVGDVTVQSQKPSLDTPVKAGYRDFINRLTHVHSVGNKLTVAGKFVRDYRWFFVTVFVVLVLIISIGAYVKSATTDQRDYEVVIDTSSKPVVISSEEIIAEKTKAAPLPVVPTEEVDHEQSYSLTLVNTSDTPGITAQVAQTLETKGYVVSELRSDLEAGRPKTVIVYDPKHVEAVTALSAEIGGALPSAFPEPISDTDKDTIIIYIGNDYQP